MAVTRVRFQQTGSLTVGNRLLPAAQRGVQSDAGRASTLAAGHRACPGCGEALAARYVLDAAARATGDQIAVVNASGCLALFSTPYPESSWRVPWLHAPPGNAPAVASGVAAALRVRGRTGVRLIAQGGDGGTVDAGFGALSGMFERNDDVLYVCYDNEGSMMAGGQRSGTTPPAASTATTPAVGPAPGHVFGQGKSVPLIAMAHQIPYVATATVADLRDLEYKVTRAMTFYGARYLHVLASCPVGWGSPPAATIALARLAVETGLFPVFEAERGEITDVSTLRAPRPVEEYLRPQRRYAHLFRPERRGDVIAQIQAHADRTIRRFGLLAQAPAGGRATGRPGRSTGEAVR